MWAKKFEIKTDLSLKRSTNLKSTRNQVAPQQEKWLSLQLTIFIYH